MPNRAAQLMGLLALLVACGTPPEPPGPTDDVLLVTLDTTRADHIGAWAGAAATPVLDELADRGVRFERAIAPAPITLPSHTSILSGLAPSAHGVRDNGIFALGPEAHLVSEVFSEAGFRTGAFVASFVLDPRFGLDQGFDVYRAPRPSDASGARGPELSAAEVVDAALGWIDGLEPEARWFAWVHFFDPHFPYVAHEGFEAASAYDGEIAYADTQLGRLLRGIAARRPDRRLLVAVTADHGEGLGDHGEESHGIFLYQSTLHVPLLLSGGPLVPAVVSGDVSLLDLAPTLLALAGLPPEALGVESPSPWFDVEGHGPFVEERPILIESLLPYYSFRWRGLRGVVWRGYKLVDAVKPELYDLDRDPAERANLAGSEPQRRKALEAELAALEPAADGGPGAERAFDATETKLLEALGYTVGSTGGDPFDAGLPDPAVRIEDVRLVSLAYNLLSRALRPGAARRGKREELLARAEAAYRELRERNPDDPHVCVGLGSVAHARGDYAAAVPWLECAVKLRPLDAGLRAWLEQSRAALAP